jgi:uncharacterized RDD family membrane protein YckC
MTEALQIGYYVFHEGETFGPFPEVEIRRLIASDLLNTKTLINVAGTPDWVELAEIAVFNQRLSGRDAKTLLPLPDLATAASFWVRLLALTFDIIAFIVLLASVAVSQSIFIWSYVAQDDFEARSISDLLAVPILIVVVLSYVILYVAACSSRWQASLGKRIFGIHVIRANGRKVSALLALARLCLYWFSSAFFYGGFLMAVFTKDRRALHDLACGTRVVKGKL